MRQLLFTLFVMNICIAQLNAGEIILVQPSTQPYLQGRTISGYITDSSSLYRISLESEHGQTELSVNSFSMNQSQYFLLPLPYNIAEGSYILRADSADSGKSLPSRTVEIASAEYPVQEIQLNRVVSELRQTTDPRREVESEHLWDILTQVNPDAVYHSEIFLRPVESSRITSEYAHQRVFLYDDGGTARSVHWGVDYAAPSGSFVVAPGAGRVSLARDRLLTGNSLIIEHLPGVYTMYYHLDRIFVEEGQLLESGEVIGEVGSTGVSTGPHLHWELRVHAIPVDPQVFFDRPLLDIGQ